MQYRLFGNTGEQISALGFGAMRLPMTPDGEHVDEEKAIPVIQRAYELGVTYFDTAPCYCKHESEIVFGKAVKPWRDEILLSTKAPIDDADGAHYRQHLETSLRKLDVEHIDFYHMWGINWKKYEAFIVAPGGPLDEARKAKGEGLIRHISFSFHDTPDALVRLIDTGHFESMAVQYNLLDRANEQAIHHAHEKGLGVVIMGPVGGGRLADLYCTGCGYCMPCPSDVNIPKNLEYMNYYRVYGLKEYARQAYADLGVKNTEWLKGLKAEYCIQCGECEPQCPQHISIVDQLEEVARVLGGGG